MGLYPVGSWSMFLRFLEIPGCLPGHQVAAQADQLQLTASLLDWDGEAVALGCRYVMNIPQAEDHGWGVPVI